MTDLQFTPNGTYNGYIRWDATDGVNTYSIVWNSEGYWEMLGWSVGDLRSYSSPNITPLDGWKLYNTRITGTFDVIQGDCIVPTPTPTNTPTPTSTSEPIPTPTPTPTQEVLINPVLIGDNEYLSVGDNEYLMFVYNEPPITLDMMVEITDGSININYNIVASSIIDEDYTFSFTNTLGLFVGDSIVINTGVTVNSGSISGATNVIIDENFSNLNPNEISFSGISVDTTGTTFNYDFNIIVDIRPPSNDFTYLIIPDSDLTYLFIPDSDLTYLLLPNNDLTSSIIPNSDITYTLLPNNDLTYEVLSCTGKTFNLVLFPYQPPSEGNIIFPNFNLGFGAATLDPNTFTEGGVYWNQIDRNGDNSYPYFENLQNPFILTFTQGIRYASYSGYSGSISYEFNMFFNNGNSGPEPQPQLTLITPSTGNFNLSEPVCISYINIDVPNPTPTPTPTETSTPTPTPTPTPTETLTPTPTPTPTSIPVNLIMDLDSTTGITGSDWSDNTEYNNNATINGGFSLDTYNGYQVVSFNGTNTFVFPTNGFGTSLDTSGFTFEVWAYPTTTSDGTLIVEWSGFPTTGWNDAQMAFVGGTINSGLFDSTSFSPTPYITGPTFSANTWYNIVMTYNGETLTQYVNGVNVGETLGIKSNPNGTYLSLGRTDTANSYLGGASGYFQGYIGLWKIWEGPLSSSQVLINYNNYLPRYVLPTPTPTPTITETPTPTVTPTKTPNCVRQITVPTLWDGGTSINSNQLKLTQTSETLQIQVNDIITDNIGATSFVGIVSSDGTYTYVFTGPGGGVSFDCQFPLTFSGNC